MNTTNIFIVAATTTSTTEPFQLFGAQWIVDAKKKTISIKYEQQRIQFLWPSLSVRNNGNKMSTNRKLKRIEHIYKTNKKLESSHHKCIYKLFFLVGSCFFSRLVCRWLVTLSFRLFFRVRATVQWIIILSSNCNTKFKNYV